MPDVAVVVGNFEGETVLPDCLASLSAQTLPPSEVIVVDAGSQDESVSIAAGAGATVLEQPNLGLGFLYNRGVESSGAEYVLLLNNDVALEPRCIELLGRELDADEKRFAADPTQLDWAGERIIHARTTLARGRLVREFIPGLHLDHVVPAETVVPTVSAHGAGMLIRRTMFVALDGFDETFFMEWEDLDLCWRGWLRGWPSVYVPQARLRHRVGGVTTAAVSSKRSTSSHHNLTRFALKCLPPGAAAVVVLGECARLPAHPRVIPKALARVAAEIPEVGRLRRAIRPSSALLDWMLVGQEGAMPVLQEPPPPPAVR